MKMLVVIFAMSLIACAPQIKYVPKLKVVPCPESPVKFHCKKLPVEELEGLTPREIDKIWGVVKEDNLQCRKVDEIWNSSWDRCKGSLPPKH